MKQMNGTAIYELKAATIANSNYMAMLCGRV